MSVADPAVQVRQHPQKGRSLHATTSFAAGETILTVTPLLILPTLSHLESICAHCLRAGEPKACTRCRAAYYCDAVCQRAAWRAVHGKECVALRKAAAEQQSRGHLPTPVRLLMQVLLLEEAGVVEAVGGLQGHVPVTGSRERRDAEMMAAGACVYSGKATREADVRTAAELLYKIQTNAFNYADDDLGQTAVFLEPTLAMMNHSCMPNAMVQVIGGKAILRAELPLEAGDEIEISYTDYTWPLSKRQAALQPYRFTCECPRCRENLSIYQACKRIVSGSTFPGLASLVPDMSSLGQHPAATDTSKSSTVNRVSEEASQDIESFPEAQIGDEQSRRSSLRTRFRACRVLLDHNAWAAAPLPHLVTAAAIFFSQQGNFVYGVALASLVVADCDPYRYTAPFHPMRVRALFMVAKLLANTAAETAMAMNSSGSSAVVQKGTGLGKHIQDALNEIDQVSLCQMILMMILKLAPSGEADKWDIPKDAQKMLQDIQQLPGREKELSLIDVWAAEPQGDSTAAFFKFAVTDPCRRLSELGKAVMMDEFGAS